MGCGDARTRPHGAVLVLVDNERHIGRRARTRGSTSRPRAGYAQMAQVVAQAGARNSPASLLVAQPRRPPNAAWESGPRADVSAQLWLGPGLAAIVAVGGVCGVCGVCDVVFLDRPSGPRAVQVDAAVAPSPAAPLSEGRGPRNENKQHSIFEL